MEKRKRQKFTSGQWAAIGAVGAALIGAVALIISSLIPEPAAPLPPTSTSTLTSVPTATPHPTRLPTATPLPTLPPSPTPPAGKPAGESDSFAVIQAYDPSGYMGDVGDIRVTKHDDVVQFGYNTLGNEPHEWDWKYKDCLPNSAPARFSGVMLLDPPNNWGVDETGGYDLRGATTVTWEARSLSGNVYVEFVIGGVTWHWKQNEKTQCWEKVPVPYPDSLPRLSLGVKQLTETTQSFQFDLSHLPQEYLRKVVGAFGWTISWADNGVVQDPAAPYSAPPQPREMIIEVSHVRYEK